MHIFTQLLFAANPNYSVFLVLKICCASVRGKSSKGGKVGNPELGSNSVVKLALHHTDSYKFARVGETTPQQVSCWSCC